MSETRKTEPGRLYFVTMTVVGWIDVFNRKEYLDELMQNLKFCQEKKGLSIYCYVIMSSHIHMIASSESVPLSYILRDFKSYTADKLFEMIENNQHESRRDWMKYLFGFFGKGIGQDRQFWEHGNFPIELYSPKVIAQKVEYIHNNPVKANIVEHPEHYIYSSANPNSPIEVLPLGGMMHG